MSTCEGAAGAKPTETGFFFPVARIRLNFTPEDSLYEQYGPQYERSYEWPTLHYLTIEEATEYGMSVMMLVAETLGYDTSGGITLCQN